MTDLELRTFLAAAPHLEPRLDLPRPDCASSSRQASRSASSRQHAISAGTRVLGLFRADNPWRPRRSTRVTREQAKWLLAGGFAKWHGPAIYTP